MHKKPTEKQYAQDWDAFKNSIFKLAIVDPEEDTLQQKQRIAHLQQNPEEWFLYYFPTFSYAPPADFHITATKRVLGNPEWYEVRAWSRELAKSTRTMMEVLYLALTGKKRNILMVSNSFDSAERLLLPYKGNLELNPRIINDYGIQEKHGSWESGKFITKKGVSFRALGAGQNPRGSKNDEVRPDVILIDDLDTDAACRNPEIINETWQWVEEALIPTRSISNPLLLIFCGNIIAETSCITRAIPQADHVDIINIRDANGKSTWPQKNTEEQIDRVLKNISYESLQKEYYNNPLSVGKIFPELYFAKCPPLSQMDFVVIYADPASSNKDKPGIKAKTQHSCKVVVVAGYKDMKYYITKAFVDTCKNDTFIDWLYTTYAVIKNTVLPYVFIENNTLQDPFYEQVFLPLIYQKSKEHSFVLPVTPDTRHKPDKYFRIEATLEPLNRMRQLVFNEDEKETEDMKRLVAQFKAVKPGSKTMDAPDAIEGAIYILKNKVAIASGNSGNSTGIHLFPRTKSPKYHG